MSDLIDRQVAIDALKVCVTIGRGNGKSVAFKIANDYADIVRKRIEALPSAQPEPLTVNFSREMDRETIEKLKEGLKNAPVLIMAVNDSAQPEIIRCKDCKWFNDIGCAIRIVDDTDKPSENDYCSFAERRTN